MSKPITNYSMDIDWHCVCGDPGSSHSSRPDGERCVGHCQRTDHDCAGQGFRPIDHAARNPAITAIFAAAMQRELPEAYSMDLSTDYQALLSYEGRFVWVLRNNGTEFYRLDDVRPEDLQHALVAYRYWALEEPNPNTHVYLWSGEGLGKIDPRMGEFVIQDTLHSLDSLNYAQP